MIFHCLLLLLSLAVADAASPPFGLTGDFACRNDDVAISIKVSKGEGVSLYLTLTATHPDGHVAAPDGEGEGTVDSSGVFRFGYEDSFSNKGKGTLRKTKSGYLLSIQIEDVGEPRCLPFYAEHLLQRNRPDGAPDHQTEPAARQP